VILERIGRRPALGKPDGLLAPEDVLGRCASSPLTASRVHRLGAPASYRGAEDLTSLNRSGDPGPHDPVLHGVHRRAGAVRHAQFAVDVLDMVSPRLGGDLQLAGDCLVGHPLGEKSQHLALARREPGPPSRPRPPTRCPAPASTTSVAMGSKRPSAACPCNSRTASASLSGPRWGRWLRHGDVNVDDRRKPCPCREHRPTDAVVIAGTVHPLAVADLGRTDQVSDGVSEGVIAGGLYRGVGSWRG
jgi:hypothetical protein